MNLLLNHLNNYPLHFVNVYVNLIVDYVILRG
jgi:hypothetical protein